MSSPDGESSDVSIHIRRSSFVDAECPIDIYAFAADGSLLANRVQASADATVNMFLPRGVTTHVAAVCAP